MASADNLCKKFGKRSYLSKSLAHLLLNCLTLCMLILKEFFFKKKVVVEKKSAKLEISQEAKRLNNDGTFKAVEQYY